MDRSLILLSGGVDSCVCLAKAIEINKKDNVGALSVYYGQKHDKELECVQKIVDFYGVRHHSLDLSFIFDTSDSTLLKGRKSVPKGLYSTQSTASGTISTYVPFRNGLFISAAASFALSNNYTQIYYGAHLNDAAHNAYPDCSNNFFEAISQAVFLGSGEKISLLAPFINNDKAAVVAEGIRLKAPFELTWSCYEGGDYPCGKCGTCIDRQNAFKANNYPDPINQKR